MQFDDLCDLQRSARGKRGEDPPVAQYDSKSSRSRWSFVTLVARSSRGYNVL